MVTPKNHKNLIHEYENNAGGQFRSEVVEVFEGRASRQNIVAHEEALEMIDKNNVPYRVSWRGLHSCDFGHIVSGKPKGNNLVGRCYVCGASLCSARGCCFSCRKCGKVVCRLHAAIFDNDPEHIQIYCKRHRWYFYIGYWFGYKR